MARIIVTDQFSPHLLHNSGRGDFKSRLGLALATATSSDERIAVGQEFVETEQRRRTDFVRALEVVAIKRERGESIAVGDASVGSLSCSPPGVNVQPGCTIDGRRMCDYDRVGQRTLSLAGNAVFAINPQPFAGYSWWRPKMVRAWAHLTANPSVPAWEGLFITSITIGTHPIEGFNTPAAAGVQDGIAFGDYVVPDNSAIAVGWPKFSNNANSRGLIVQGIGLWPAASAYIAYMTVLGNALDDAGRECRCNPGSAAIPDVPKTNGGSAGPWRPV